MDGQLHVMLDCPSKAPRSPDATFTLRIAANDGEDKSGEVTFEAVEATGSPAWPDGTFVRRELALLGGSDLKEDLWIQSYYLAISEHQGAWDGDARSERALMAFRTSRVTFTQLQGVLVQFQKKKNQPEFLQFFRVFSKEDFLQLQTAQQAFQVHSGEIKRALKQGASRARCTRCGKTSTHNVRAAVSSNVASRREDSEQ